MLGYKTVNIKMADEGQVEDPGGATAGIIRRVPGNLLGFLTSRIAEYVDRTKGITAEIHEYPGQPAKLVLYGAKGNHILTYKHVGVWFDTLLS